MSADRQDMASASSINQRKIMKQIASLALLALASAAASAQSSVTLFGIVDAAAREVKNGSQSLKSLASGGINTSRFGFRGTEDLGDGLKAGFWLESGFNTDTGSSSDTARFFNRRATISLSGGFGELRLGRDFTPTYLAYSDYDPFGSNGVASGDKFSGVVLNSGADTATRSDNEVAYFLPSGLGGLYGVVAVAPGESTTGAATGKRYTSGRIGYAAGPVNVSGAYGETKVAPNFNGDNSYKIMVVGGSFDFGVAKLTGSYTASKFGPLKYTTLNAGVLVPIGSGTLRAGYISGNASGVTAGFNVDTEPNDSKQFAVGYLYDLSKRTTLYTTYARVTNKGNAAINVGTPPTLLAGGTSSGYEFGIRHKF
jgi:predicted porin